MYIQYVPTDSFEERIARERAKTNVTGKQRLALAETNRMEAAGVRKDLIVARLRTDPKLSGVKIGDDSAAGNNKDSARACVEIDF